MTPPAFDFLILRVALRHELEAEADKLRNVLLAVGRMDQFARGCERQKVDDAMRILTAAAQSYDEVKAQLDLASVDGSPVRDGSGTND